MLTVDGWLHTMNTQCYKMYVTFEAPSVHFFKLSSLLVVVTVVVVVLSSSSTIAIIKTISQSRLLIKNMFSHILLSSFAMCSRRHCDVSTRYVNDWLLLRWTRPFPVSLVDVLNILNPIGGSAVLPLADFTHRHLKFRRFRWFANGSRKEDHKTSTLK